MLLRLILAIASILLVMMVSMLVVAPPSSDMRPKGECKAPEECGDSLLALSKTVSSQRVSLQVAEHKVLKHLAKSRKPTEGLVLSLRQLATDRIAKQENCSEDLQDIFDEVENQTQIVIDAELNASVAEQNRVNDAYARVVQCNTDLQGSPYSSSSSVDAARSTHASCRTEQAQLCSSESTLCAAFESFRSSLSYPSCVYSDSGGPAPVTGACMQTLSIWLNANNATFFQQKHACEDASANCQAKQSACDQNQASFEMSYCTHATGHNEDGTEYITCYNQETEFYHTTVAEVSQAIATMKAEYEAAVQTQCLIQALNISASVVEQAQVLAACNEVDLSPLDITYPDELPAMLSHTPVTSMPCDDGWLQQEYASLASPTATCVACPAGATS